MESIKNFLRSKQTNKAVLLLHKWKPDGVPGRRSPSGPVSHSYPAKIYLQYIPAGKEKISFLQWNFTGYINHISWVIGQYNKTQWFFCRVFVSLCFAQTFLSYQPCVWFDFHFCVFIGFVCISCGVVVLVFLFLFSSVSLFVLRR